MFRSHMSASSYRLFASICLILFIFAVFFYFSEIPLVGLIPDCQNFRLSKNFEYKQKSCESINKREARS